MRLAAADGGGYGLSRRYVMRAGDARWLRMAAARLRYYGRARRRRQWLHGGGLPILLLGCGRPPRIYTS
jgi:hypothetical protein